MHNITTQIACTLAGLLLFLGSWAHAQQEGGKVDTSLPRISVYHPISSAYYPVVLSGEKLAPMFHSRIQDLALFTQQEGIFRPIPFQIDPRNEKGRFIFPDHNDSPATEKSGGEAVFDGNDELVFMAKDLGTHLQNPYVALAAYSSLGIESVIEIEVRDRRSGNSGWLYLVTSQNADTLRSNQDYVIYNDEHDTIHSDVYQLGFAQQHPFLIDRMQWKNQDTGQWSSDFTDTMKIRHSGKLFHQFDFDRNQDDYASTLVAVKDGPVRVIRKTDNRVRILWFIRTPAIEIDFIAYPNSFVVDTLIQMRFTVGKFFSDATTMFTMDWSEETPQRIYSRSIPAGAAIDGIMDAADVRFNQSGDTEMIIENPYGKMLVAMDMEPSLPLTQQLFLQDDKNRPDPPEQITGQFGNTGFLTRNWEMMDTELHHIIFRVYMTQGLSLQEGFRVLEQAPVSWQQRQLP